MPGQYKEGLEYFSFNVGLLEDRKFRRVKLKYGYLAPMVYISLLSILYKDKGYYIDYGDDKKDDVLWDILNFLQGKYQPTAETVAEIIEELVACGLFSGDQFNSKIITSTRAQKVFYHATVDRKAVKVDFDKWLLTEEEMRAISEKSLILREYINRPINEINRPNEPINRPNDTQRIEKNRIEKKSKEESICGEPEQAASPPVIGLPLNDSTEHPIYQSDIEEWENLYPLVDVIQEIRKMRGWLLSNPERRKTKRGIKRFINNWLSREQDKGHGVKATASKGTNKFTNYSQRQYDYKDIERMAAERLKNATI